MAMFPSMASNLQIDQIIRSEKFKLFHEKVRAELDIENIEYEILVDDFVNDNEGYCDSSINARMKINSEWNSIDALIFYKEGLVSSINSKFSKLPSFYFDNAVEICIKFALVHELVHVQQFKKGILTQEKLRVLDGIPYENRDIEIEANKMAKEILSRESEFNKDIISILINNKILDNDELYRIINLHDTDSL